MYIEATLVVNFERIYTLTAGLILINVDSAVIFQLKVLVSE